MTCRALLRLGVVALLLAFSQASWALVCKSSQGGSYLSEYIGPVSVPDTVPDGTIIWRSKTHVVPADCWKVHDIHFQEDDPIYFYGNPAGLDATPWGIEVRPGVPPGHLVGRRLERQPDAGRQQWLYIPWLPRRSQ